MPKDYYQILGLGKGASQEEIKTAFRKLAHQHHPDKKGGDVEKFKEINEAYQVLSNAEKRQQYDQFGTTFDGAQGFGGGAGGFNWQDFARQQGGGQGGVHFDFGDFDLGDIFGQAFGFGGGGRRRRQQHGPQRGADIQTILSLSFEDAVKGTKAKVQLTRTERCAHCSGNGAEPGTALRTCTACNGAGEQVQAQKTPFGTFQTRTTCRECLGEGKSFEKPCAQCRGRGQQDMLRELEINVPAGIDQGEAIRLSGEGHAGLKGGPAGDLYLQVKIEPSKIFAREGYDILSKTVISFPTAVLGGKVPVQTLDGPVDLKIPAGTQGGTVLKLKGKGVQRLHGRGRGDHLVEVEIKTPVSVSRHARKLLEELEGEV
jgi:molecular chaperone DnaJ